MGHFSEREGDTKSSESFFCLAFESLVHYAVPFEYFQNARCLHGAFESGILGHGGLRFQNGCTASFAHVPPFVKHVVKRENGIFSGVAVFYKKFLDFGIPVACKYDSKGFFPVASGTADFLVIVLDAPGKVVVDHEPDVLFVDSHTERVRGNDHLQFSIHESVLSVFPIGVVHGSGIHADRYAFLEEETVDFIHRFPTRTIHDPRTGNALDDLKGFFELFLFRTDLPDEDDEIFPVESLRKYVVFSKSEPFHDVFADFFRGSCRQCDGGEAGGCF